MLETALSGLVNAISLIVLLGFSPLTPVVYYGTEMSALILDQKVKVQGHDGIIYAGTVTA